MEFKQYLSILWKWSWLMVLSTLVAATSAYWATSDIPPVYETSTTLMVGRFIQTADPTGQDFAITSQLARSYVALARRQPVLEGTIETLGLNMSSQALAGRVGTNLVPGTQLIQISVKDGDPQRAKVLADEIARQLILQSPTPAEQEQTQHRQFIGEQLQTLQDQIKEAEEQIEELEGRMDLENSARGIQDIQNRIQVLQQKLTNWRGDYADLMGFYEGSRTNYLSVMETAVLPTTPVGSNRENYIFLAAAIGFTLAAGAAFLIEYLDDTIKADEDVDRVLNLPTLGSITRIHRIQEPSDHLVTMQAAYSPDTETFRILRTNLQFSNLTNPSPLVLVTSASAGEGKTTVASNLGITIAYTGERVILVDADLRRPSTHRLFGTANQVGLTSLLLDDTLPVEAALVETPVVGLKLMPSGPLPPNPADLLGSVPMKKRLEQMKELADMIIFDSPPVLPVADATILGTLCSGVILVVDAGRTRSPAARRAKEAMDHLNLKVMGVVLNKLSPRHTRDYSYYSYYYSYANGRRQPKRNRRSKAPAAGQAGMLSRLMRRPGRKPPASSRPPVVEPIAEGNREV
jgi:non-specific protein-tyrosine kinase